MPKALRLETRAWAGFELRQRIVRMLVGVAGQRRKCFELSNSRQPAFYMNTRALPPRLDRHGKLCAPQQKCGKRREKLVACRIQEFHEPVQPFDLARGRQAFGFDFLLQPNKTRRGELLALESIEHLR